MRYLVAAFFIVISVSSALAQKKEVTVCTDFKSVSYYGQTILFHGVDLAEQAYRYFLSERICTRRSIPKEARRTNYTIIMQVNRFRLGVVTYQFGDDETLRFVFELQVLRQLDDLPI